MFVKILALFVLTQISLPLLVDERRKEVLDTVIWFHFKEGYSNAVRRSVRVQDFL